MMGFLIKRRAVVSIDAVHFANLDFVPILFLYAKMSFALCVEVFGRVLGISCSIAGVIVMLSQEKISINKKRCLIHSHDPHEKSLGDRRCLNHTTRLLPKATL